MSTDTKAPSADQILSPKPNPFTHRFDTDNAHDSDCVENAFFLIAGHAQGVLNSLFFQFEGDGRMNNETIQNSIDSVCFMIDDMKAIIRAHFDAVKADKEGAA